ncbi:hypothetical protein MICA_1434 [Micavibrio aeruginosavorus ARL-13]|uniref:Uncharacterized protein n=1 Tax=Micavibrio aeruginosavorus (strain ARL-13) TaxID=856793 RepID=G2KM56_MICAA|nr:hypothetical protein MICA_1434 [Micavibrio aeruginosavorus ARL-13]
MNARATQDLTHRKIRVKFPALLALAALLLSHASVLTFASGLALKLYNHYTI